MAAGSPDRGMLEAAVVAGLIAALLGALTVVGYADHIGGWEPPVSGETVASVGSKALMVAAEALFCLVFAGFSHLAATAAPDKALGLALTALVGKVLCSFGAIAANWPSGWYYILDPSGPHPTSLLLLVASVIQAALIGVAVARLAPAASATPPAP